MWIPRECVDEPMRVISHPVDESGAWQLELVQELVEGWRGSPLGLSLFYLLYQYSRDLQTMESVGIQSDPVSERLVFKSLFCLHDDILPPRPNHPLRTRRLNRPLCQKAEAHHLTAAQFLQALSFSSFARALVARVGRAQQESQLMGLAEHFGQQTWNERRPCAGLKTRPPICWDRGRSVIFIYDDWFALTELALCEVYRPPPQIV